MSTEVPVLGEIRLFAYGRLPEHWLPCDGQQLQIGDHQALYSVLGTTYGGDGRRTFHLPDLRGRAVVGAGPAHPLAAQGGSETHTLTAAEAASHRHELFGSADSGTTSSPDGAVPGTAGRAYYATGPAPSQRVATAMRLTDTHVTEPHENRQPYLVVQYAILTRATFPDFRE